MIGKVRCSRCGIRLYAKPHGIRAGQSCHQPIPAEYQPDNSVITLCPGVFKRVRA
jgi:hypothetical protein